MIFTPFYQSNAVEVIVNSHAQLAPSSLTTYQLRQIYTMRQTVWQNNQAIVVYALPNDSLIHQNFSKEVLKIFPYQLDRIWHKLIYSGLSKVPIVVASLDELKVAVANTPGAIGYIDDFVEGEAFYVVEIKD